MAVSFGFLSRLIFSGATDVQCAAAVTEFIGDINARAAGLTVLQRAIMMRFRQTVFALSARGDVELGRSNIRDRSPIHFAAVSEGMVSVLFDAFPEVKRQLNVRDDGGDTALHIAAAYYWDNVELLLDYGADSTLRNKRGRTAEEYARDAVIAAVFAKHAAWKTSDRRAWMAAVTVFSL